MEEQASARTIDTTPLSDVDIEDYGSHEAVQSTAEALGSFLSLEHINMLTHQINERPHNSSAKAFPVDERNSASKLPK